MYLKRYICLNTNDLLLIYYISDKCSVSLDLLYENNSFEMAALPSEQQTGHQTYEDIAEPNDLLGSSQQDFEDGVIYENVEVSL